MVKIKLSDLEKGRLFGAAHAVWNDIGYDVLRAIAEDKGKDINAVTVSKADVVEIVLDADRLSEYLRERKLLTPALTQLLNAYDGQVGKLLKKECFLFARYGM